MRRLLFSFILFLSVIIQSCSTAPKREVMVKAIKDYELPEKPTEDKAMVYVVRPSGLGSMIRFQIFLDGTENQDELGWTKGNQHFYFTIDPGKHCVHSLAENWSRVQVDLKKGESIFLKQTPTMGFIMARGTLSEVDEVVGKYYMKKTKPGTKKSKDNIGTKTKSNNPKCNEE